MNPESVMHLMDGVSTTMIDAVKGLHKRQKEGNVEYHFFTVNDCFVNMIPPEQYGDFVWPFEKKSQKHSIQLAFMIAPGMPDEKIIQLLKIVEEINSIMIKKISNIHFSAKKGEYTGGTISG